MTVVFDLFVRAETWRARLTRRFGAFPFAPLGGMNIQYEDGAILTINPNDLHYDLDSELWMVTLEEESLYRDVPFTEAKRHMENLTALGWTLESCREHALTVSTPVDSM